MVVGEGVGWHVLGLVHVVGHVTLTLEFVGVFFHPQDLKAVMGNGLLEFGDLDFAVV